MTTRSPIFSVGLLLGFAYCPAMRPMRTCEQHRTISKCAPSTDGGKTSAYDGHTGTPDDNEREGKDEPDLVRDILLRPLGMGIITSVQHFDERTCVQASKLSAQSPAWRRNAWLCCTWVSLVLSLSTWEKTV